jgi:hypothetical protein
MSNKAYQKFFDLFNELPTIKFDPDWINRSMTFENMVNGKSVLTIEQCRTAGALCRDAVAAAAFVDNCGRCAVYLRNGTRSAVIFENFPSAGGCYLHATISKDMDIGFQNELSKNDKNAEYVSPASRELDDDNFLKILKCFPINIS